MALGLPDEVVAVFERFVTTEYTTVDGRGRPITWPVTPYPEWERGCVDVTTGLGYPKKARDAEANPKVALLFSDPTGSGMEDPPMVLVQGIADVDDRDLEANRDRYWRESSAKLPGTEGMHPPKAMRRFFDWYYTRIYVHVRPERVYVWPQGDAGREPQLLDTHIEEVRSGHVEEPYVPPGPVADELSPAWDARMAELGSLYRTAVLSLVAPDGFPFSVRLPVEVDEARRRLLLGEGAVGVPMRPGPACVTAHDHHPYFKWQRNFQVRGDLVERDGRWELIPRRLVGGFELPPGSTLGRYRANLGKIRRFRRTAKRELAGRSYSRPR